MQVFSREIMAKVARQFYWYYNNKQRSITIKEAMQLIDFELGGSCTSLKDIGSIDYSKPSVKTSNIHRPTESQIEQIYEKIDAQNVTDKWDSVFDELLNAIKGDREMMKFVLLVFKHQYSNEQVGGAMHITRSTYYQYRSTVLTKAAIIAIANAVIKE